MPTIANETDWNRIQNSIAGMTSVADIKSTIEAQLNGADVSYDEPNNCLYISLSYIENLQNLATTVSLSDDLYNLIKINTVADINSNINSAIDLKVKLT